MVKALRAPPLTGGGRGLIGDGSESSSSGVSSSKRAFTLAKQRPRALKVVRLALVGMASFALAVAGHPQVGAGRPVECFGSAVPASHVGGPGNNEFVGTNRADRFFGGGGNDHIRGLGGPDKICGGRGRDLLEGGRGSDQIDGQVGHDSGNKPIARLIGGRGNDLIRGGPGEDWLFLEEGMDTGRGQADDDQLSSFDEVDGNDIVDGGGQTNGDICGGDMNDKFLNCEFFE
jgi:Ca2+-binding RTX toxin-like protein